MKKLKLRGRELEKLGFPSGKISGMIIDTVKKEFKGADKQQILELLEQLKSHPKKFLNHPVFEQVAYEIVTPKQHNKKVPERTLATEEKPYICYGKEYIELEALGQMETAMRLPITVKGALMPDAHVGYGLPIGGVLATDNAVIPYGVGMDIGCRMCMSILPVEIDRLDNKKALLKEILLENTRFRRNEFPGRKEHELLDRKEFQNIKFLHALKDMAYKQLGTSGSGNHFVEFGKLEVPQALPDLNLEPGTYLAVLSHSGSRNFGASIARHYTKLAKQLCPLPKGERELSWLSLDQEEGQEYWNAMQLAGDYAKANHEIIHKNIAKAFQVQPLAKVENHHNFAWKEQLEDGTTVIVHRKGATPAGKDDLGIIPGSMTLPGFIVKGKGSLDSINSASHGAGRQMSRSEAKKRITKKSLVQTLKKADVELIGGDLDEAPEAYKNIHTVMEKQKDLVDCLATFYPKIVRMA